MKIVQSFWSRPYLQQEDDDLFNRAGGGWLHPKYNILSWALSCLRFCTLYPKVELYTDSAGKALLIDKLKLPYTKVHICLDQLNRYNPKLWALGKLYVYGLQDEPFIHADGDVYVWDRFDHAIERSPLIAQNSEADYEYYKIALHESRSHLTYFPDALLKTWSATDTILAANAGVIGGTDIEFFRAFSAAAFEFIAKNETNFQKINTGLFNIIVEQHLFSCMAFQSKKAISYILPTMSLDFSEAMPFNVVPTLASYVHLVGNGKKNALACEQVEKRLAYEFPVYYRSIIKNLPTQANSYPSPEHPPSLQFSDAFVRTMAILHKENIDIGLLNETTADEQIEQASTLLANKQALQSLSMLNAIYTFEKERFYFIRTCAVNPTNPQRATALTKKVFDLLYQRNPDSLLNQQLVLSNIVYLANCKYYMVPNFNTAQDLNINFENYISEQKSILVYQSAHDHDYKEEILDSFNLLLTNFVQPVTGNELIQAMLEDPGISAAFSEEQLRYKVFFMITERLLYNNILEFATSSGQFIDEAAAIASTSTV